MIKKEYSQNILLFASVIVVAILLAEVILRLFLPITPKRYLLWSSPTFATDSSGAVMFAKNTSVREVAVYNDAIEYDMIYKTNNFGSVDHANYNTYEDQDAKRQAYAFVGDSFTAGSGGYPWVAELRDKLHASKKNITIYNLGIPGTGLSHFLKILESTSPRLKFTDIVILASGDDFRRPYWLPINKDGEIYFWFPGYETKETGLNHRIARIASVIDKDATKDEIMIHVKRLEQQQRALEKPLKKDIKYFFKKSMFLSLIKARLVKLFNKPVKDEIDFSPLIRIRSLFPKTRIYFIHLPEKIEVINGKYSLELKSPVEALGIKYFPGLTKISWHENMFYQHDGHPNKIGYRAISDCIEKLLFS